MQVYSRCINNTLTGLLSLLKEELEAEMSRLRLEIKKTMDLYKSICEQAAVAKQQVSTIKKNSTFVLYSI